MASRNRGTKKTRHDPAPYSLVRATHSAAAQLLDDAVMRNGLANHGMMGGMLGRAHSQVNLRRDSARHRRVHGDSPRHTAQLLRALSGEYMYAGGII